MVLTFFLTSEALHNFVYFYPLFMSGIWMTGGVLFWAQWERHWSWRPAPPPSLPDFPLISILIPCFNEEENGEATILAALHQEYPNLEVIAINDGSDDGTAVMLNRLAASHDKLRAIHLAQNQGKAMALRMGALAARGEYLICIDGDALLDPDATRYLVDRMDRSPGVGAVTGNPRVGTRSTLIGQIQVGEFSSIIGLIKRTQRVYGQLFTVSGAVTAFRRQALNDVGYWSLDMVTEDIDITWKLQRADWQVLYEPRALCWILMPETLRGLWKQRTRWSKGGAQVLLKNLDIIWQWKHRRLWPLLIDYCLSIVWAFALALFVALWVLSQFFTLPPSMAIGAVVPPSFTGMVLAMMCLMQFTVSVLIDRRYEPDLHKALYWVVWYPFVFWTINLFTTIYSFPTVMLRVRRQRARWNSPDRGIKEPP